MLEIVRFSCYQENWSLRPVGDGTLRHSSRRAGRGGQRVGRQTCCVTPSHSLLTLLNCVAVSVGRKTVSIALKHWWVYSRPCLGLSLLWIEALFHPPYAMLEACQNAPRYPGAYCRLKRQGSRNRNSSFSSQNGKLIGFSSHKDGLWLEATARVAGAAPKQSVSPFRRPVRWSFDYRMIVA